jgi:hypothetical protein
VLLDSSKRKVAMAGRRGGKTVLEIAEVGVTCIQDGGFCGWGSPNFPILRDAWRDLKAEFAPWIAQVRESEWTIEFQSGGRLECWSMDSGIIARGRKYHKFIVDEAGLVSDLGLRFDQEIEPTLGDFDGVLVAGSTPNLVGPDLLTWFHLGQQVDSGWKSWRWSSIDNPAVAANMAKLIERARQRGTPDWIIRQEYYAEPAESDRSFFRRADIDAHKRQHAREPIERGFVDAAPGEDRFATIKLGQLVAPMDKRPMVTFRPDPGGVLRIWERPNPLHIHCMGVDLGYGVGSSNTVFSVGNRHTRTKVAEYAWPGVTPEEAAMLAAALAIWYSGPTGPAYICAERNGPGEVFFKRMHEIEFGGLWYERRPASAVMHNDLTMRYGWNSSKESKEALLGEYRSALTGGKFYNPSAVALDECLTYQYDDQFRITSPFDRTKARDDPARVKHGDRVIADALLNLCFDWTGEPIQKPGPVFQPGSYGDLFGLDKKLPELFKAPGATGWVSCER